ncbi:MAG: hypothetical protein NC395_05515 [Prevotella sp.]|nr:hypothetical protein [Prevotella sp.]
MTDERIVPQKRSDGRLTVLAALYFAGVFLGVILYGTLDGERLAALNGITGSFVYGRLNHTFWETLVNSFSGAFLLLTACFWLGFSAAAQPLELLVPVFRGLGAGVSLAGMYGSFGLAGVGMSAVLIIPGAVLSAFALIIAAREALEMSGRIFSAVFGRSASGGEIDLRLYITKFAILFVILTVSSLADSLATFIFAGFWTGLL